VKNPFTEHPHEVGETYFQHARFAVGCGLKLIKLGFTAIIHGVMPFLFKTTVSDSLPELAGSFRERRSEMRQFNKAIDRFKF